MQDKWQEKLHNVRDDLLRETVELLDQHNAVLNETLKETKDRIGVSSKGTGEGRTELTKDL